MPAIGRPAASLVGRKFGDLTVRERVANSKNAHARWLCDCACGGTIIRESSYLAMTAKTAKIVVGCKSCAASRRAKSPTRRTKHGGAVSGSRWRRLYRIWQSMTSRCRLKKYKYRNYSGRGVQVRWANFAAFKEWALSSGYDDTLTLDRIDSWGDYCPENCRWVTLSENSRRSNYQQRFKRLEIKWSSQFPPSLPIEAFGGF